MDEPTKQCTLCGQHLTLSCFHRRRHYVRAGVRAACRACTLARAKERREVVGVVHDARKELVRARTRAAIARGALTPAPCIDCGDTHVEAHHPDYSAQDAHLHVQWLCRLHHAARHGRRSWTRQLELQLAS